MDTVVFPTDAPVVHGPYPAPPGWRRAALCLGQDPEIWYPIDAGGVEAVAICAACPVRLDCLGWPLEHNERDGIWGGVSARGRRRIRADARLTSKSAAGALQFDHSQVPKRRGNSSIDAGMTTPFGDFAMEH
jgi:WhiB family redox-sensing transcriptional regulator